MHSLEVIARRNRRAVARELAHADNDALRALRLGLPDAAARVAYRERINSSGNTRGVLVSEYLRLAQEG